MAPWRPDMQFAIRQLSTQVLKPTTESKRAVKQLYDISKARNTLVVVLNRAKWFKQVCWNSLVVVTQIGPAIRQQTRVLRNIIATICNRSLKQTAISLSSSEAEFYAASACAGELLGLAELFKELHYKVSVRLEMDSRRLSIQQWIREKRLSVSRVDTKNNTADLFMKHLDGLRTIALAKK